jgi:thymidylate synthase (FAD)
MSKIISIEYTEPKVTVIESGGGPAMPVAAANCTTAEPVNNLLLNYSDNDKLVERVLEYGHTSIAEFASLTFMVSGINLATSHQLVRHRHASYAQRSQRYVTHGDVYKVSVPYKMSAERDFDDHLRRSFRLYHQMLEDGYPAEEARLYLPSCTETQICVQMNLRALMNFLSERLCSCAQSQIREVALQLLVICKQYFPHVFKDFGPKCKQLGYCPESKKKCCGLMPHKSIIIK